jgi:hypothetical protein
MKKCPKCGSDKVCTSVLVHGFAWVNVNTLNVRELPNDVDFDYRDLECADTFSCSDCDYFWSEAMEF